MGLLADALAKRIATTELCVVARQVAEFDDETQGEFADYAAAILAWRAEHGQRSPNGPNVKELRSALRALGVVVGQDALADHVAGRCSCGVG